MQVKPEGRETEMPKFKHGDEVLISLNASNPYAGERGVIFGEPRFLSVSYPTGFVGESQPLATDSENVYEYNVDIAGVDGDAWVLESDLIAV